MRTLLMMSIFIFPHNEKISCNTACKKSSMHLMLSVTKNVHNKSFTQKKSVHFIAILYDLGGRISLVWPNFDFKIRRDHGKISYKCRVYESVDDRSLS